MTKPFNIKEGIVALIQVGCKCFLNNRKLFDPKSIARRNVSGLSVGRNKITLYRGF